MVEELDMMRKDVANCEARILEMLRWQAEHDGRINAWWEQQFKLNTDLMTRVSIVERRMIYASGFAAGVGALIGASLYNFWA